MRTLYNKANVFFNGPETISLTDPETGRIAEETPYYDDAHSYRVTFHNDSEGNPVISASDLYDFGENYSEGFGDLYEERTGAKNGKKRLEIQRRF